MIPRDILQKKFRIFILLSLFILLIEVAGGFFTNSLALLSDAGHVLIDLLALVLAYFSLQLSQKKSTKKFSFGYYRAEIFAAIINGTILIFVTLYIFYESYIRFLSLQPIKGTEMLIISVVGLLANLYVVIKMQGYEKENLSIRGAYLHVLSDTLSSVGVVAAGILIVVTDNYIFDPIISSIIGLFILISSLQLIRESSHILMEATPENIDLEKLSEDIQKIDGVKEIHDLHVWSISSDVYALSSHVLITAKNINSMNKIVSNINDMIKSKYNITHTVLQSECENCVYEENEHGH
ncbi:MAG: cation diffusion facilitator family transporter [Nitrospinota bacterium]